MMLSNIDLRKEIAWMTWHSKEGHIPSAYSIVDLVNFLYEDFLNFDARNPLADDRDYFVLSKGHGCAALYAVLKKIGLLTQRDLEEKNTQYAKLATHPDRTKIIGVEASTGSLGNGIGFAVGIALSLSILKKRSKVICVIGDAESNEGTVWECALLGSQHNLGNLCVILDNNHSCDPTLPVPNPAGKWSAFGWDASEVDGHNVQEIRKVMSKMEFCLPGRPKLLVANTVKGKGVGIMEENYGGWHSKVPNDEELKKIYSELDNYEQ